MMLIILNTLWRYKNNNYIVVLYRKLCSPYLWSYQACSCIKRHTSTVTVYCGAVQLYNGATVQLCNCADITTCLINNNSAHIALPVLWANLLKKYNIMSRTTRVVIEC